MRIRKFLAAIWSDWTTRMSGPLTVPFTIAAFLVPSGYRYLFAALALTAAFITCYQVWAKEYEKAETERGKRQEAESELAAEAPRLIFGLLNAHIDWAIRPGMEAAEYIFTIANYGKRPAVYVEIDPIRSPSGKTSLCFGVIDVLRADSRHECLEHLIEDAGGRRLLDKKMLWEFLHESVTENNQARFHIVIRFRDLDIKEVNLVQAQMVFDGNTKQLTVFPH